MSSTLMAAISTLGGDYGLDAGDLGEFDSLQKELEYTTATMYLLSQRKLDYGLSVAIPAMTLQLQQDATHAGLYGSVAPEYERAVVGISNAAAASVSTAMSSLLASSSVSQRSGYLWQAERMTYTAAAMVASLTALSKSSAYEAYRMARDNSLSYLFSDIEHATKVRGIGDELGSIGMSSMFTAAKEHLDAAMHSANMAQIAWDKEQIRKKFDTKAFDIGSLVGQAVSGLSDGYAASKADAALAAGSGK